MITHMFFRKCGRDGPHDVSILKCDHSTSIII